MPADRLAAAPDPADAVGARPGRLRCASCSPSSRGRCPGCSTSPGSDSRRGRRRADDRARQSATDAGEVLAGITTACGRDHVPGRRRRPGRRGTARSSSGGDRAPGVVDRAARGDGRCAAPARDRAGRPLVGARRRRRACDSAQSARRASSSSPLMRRNVRRGRLRSSSATSSWSAGGAVCWSSPSTRAPSRVAAPRSSPGS